MNKSIITTAMLLALSGNVVADDFTNPDKAKNEFVGFSSGIALGAAIAGPAGAMIAGVIGIVTADGVNNKIALEHATNKLNDKQSELAALTLEYQQLSALVKRQKSEARLRHVSMNTELLPQLKPMESSIQFKTASYTIEPLYQQQLDGIANQLRSDQQLQLQISGYADRRGDDAFNQILSEQRATSVKNHLLNRGVHKKQIQTFSYGESRPANEVHDFEHDFFDRRVLLRLQQIKPELTASN